VILFTALATIGFAAPASAATASAPTATGSVTGHIVDSAGAPVPNFSVILATGETTDTYHAYRATTDASGAFTVTDVLPASYQLLDEEPDWFEAGNGWASVRVPAGAAVTVPAETAIRAATVSGKVVSSVDGSPLPGQVGFGNGPSATTDTKGMFTIAVRPGIVTIHTAGQRFWSTAERTVDLAEGATTDLGVIALDPLGLATTTFTSRSHRAIEHRYESAVVDGRRVSNAHPSTCPDIEVCSTVDSLRLEPGRHTIRYEVRSPVTAAVRHVTRSVEVAAGQETAVPTFVVPILDPATRAVVERATYTRGRAVVIRVVESTYVDGEQPRLPVTIRVSGHVVKPTSTRWTTRHDGVHVLVATLPSSLSKHATLEARVIVHGTSAYTGQTSAATRLTRAS
jgi:hypothetical protein